MRPIPDGTMRPRSAALSCPSSPASLVARQLDHLEQRPQLGRRDLPGRSCRKHFRYLVHQSTPSVYATGHSSRAVRAERMACDAEGVFASVAGCRPPKSFALPQFLGGYYLESCKLIPFSSREVPH
jgi:hypothetical protein